MCFIFFVEEFVRCIGSNKCSNYLKHYSFTLKYIRPALRPITSAPASDYDCDWELFPEIVPELWR
jgi:hypothetical protein